MEQYTVPFVVSGFIVLAGLYCLWRFKWQPKASILLICAVPYLLPIILATILPYEYIYPASTNVVLMALALSFFQAMVLQFCILRNLKPMPNQPPRLQPWVLGVAISSVFLLFVELATNRAVVLSSDLGANRDVLEYMRFPGKAATILSGACMFCLFYVPHQQSLIRRCLYLTPWALFSGLNLLLGNRQFLFFGILLLFFGWLITLSRLSKLFGIRLAVLFVAIVGLLFTVQFARSRITEGRQARFLQSVSGVSVKGHNLISENYYLDSAATTLFVYYGCEYGALSAMIDSNVHVSFPLHATFPLLYRRISVMFSWPDGTEVREDIFEMFMADLGYFPHIWHTMFGDFFSEFGFISLAGYFAAILIAMGLSFYICRRDSLMTTSITVFWAALFVFGIEYFVFRENYAYGLAALLLLPKHWTVARNGL